MAIIDTGNWYNRKLENHVENRTCITLRQAELNLFETHKQAQEVALSFSDPVLASMLEGKKVMALGEGPKFSFLPGESVMMRADETMLIDFPEAKQKRPTKCLALRIDQSLINHTIDYLNALAPRQDEQNWSRKDHHFHFTNDTAIHQILKRLIFTFTENHPSKDLFSEMMIKEMIIRILQNENKHHLIHKTQDTDRKGRFAFVLDYIHQNLSENISIAHLSKLVGMSESAFFKAFKNELGLTPNEFVIQERLRIAESYLKNREVSVKEAYLSSGFNSFSYFCRLFKKHHQLSPGEFKAINQLS